MSAVVVPMERRRHARDLESLLHDLRGPLTVIRGQCHAIVRQGGRNGDLIGRLGLIDAEVDRISAAIDEVRMALHGDPPREETDVVELRALLIEAVRRHEGVAGERGLALRLESFQPRVEVVGRRSELRRVLDNLLTNAVRHAPYGTTVTLTCDARGGTADVTVANDGPAPARPAPLRWAFQPCGDADPSPGWGLGLGIVDDLVTRHSGTVVVEPATRGPSVRVSLPRVDRARP